MWVLGKFYLTEQMHYFLSIMISVILFFSKLWAAIFHFCEMTERFWSFMTENTKNGHFKIKLILVRVWSEMSKVALWKVVESIKAKPVSTRFFIQDLFYSIIFFLLCFIVAHFQFDLLFACYTIASFMLLVKKIPSKMGNCLSLFHYLFIFWILI